MGKEFRQVFSDNISKSDQITQQKFRADLLMNMGDLFKEYKDEVDTMLGILTGKGDKESFNFSILEFALTKYAVSLGPQPSSSSSRASSILAGGASRPSTPATTRSSSMRSSST